MPTLKRTTDFFENGKKLDEKYNQKKDGRPFMCPPAPNQKWFDIYDPKDFETNPQLKDEAKQQGAYEAETQVYRAFEKLKESMLVLHGFSYSRSQLRIWLKNHPQKQSSEKVGKCKKDPNSDEAEHDFVVIGPDYIAILEVKSTSGRFAGTAKKNSQEQQRRFWKLIEGIFATAKVSFPHFDSSNIRLFGITALPNQKPTPFDSAVETGKRYMIKIKNMADEYFCPILMLSRIQTIWCDDRQPRLSIPETFCINSEDLNNNFQKWWTENINPGKRDYVAECDSTEEIRYALLALWATDKKGNLNETSFSLTHCIDRIDQRIRTGEITRFSQNTKNPNVKNPNVVKTSDIKLAEVNGVNIFSDILKIKFLSVEQKKAYESASFHLLIQGSAGSGKTSILLARIIRDLGLKTIEKAILFTRKTEYVSIHRKILNEAIRQKIFAKTGLKIAEVSKVSGSAIRDNQILLVDNLNSLSSSKEHIARSIHVYVDDIHSDYNFEDLGFRISCAAVDTLQCNFLVKIRDGSKQLSKYGIRQP